MRASHGSNSLESLCEAESRARRCLGGLLPAAETFWALPHLGVTGVLQKSRPYRLLEALESFRT
jgi:hypothetical protein